MSRCPSLSPSEAVECFASVQSLLDERTTSRWFIVSYIRIAADMRRQIKRR